MDAKSAGPPAITAPAGEPIEVPVAAILDELGFSDPLLAAWWDHLDAFFARHGGARHYSGLAALVAEARAALAAPGREGQGRGDPPPRGAG